MQQPSIVVPNPMSGTLQQSQQPQQPWNQAYLDPAFARRGRALAIASGLFAVLSLCLCVAACSLPWVNVPMSKTGAGFMPIPECSLSIGLVHYGYYGTSCPATYQPKWGENTMLQQCTIGFSVAFAVCSGGYGLIALAILLASLAAAGLTFFSSTLSCERYNRSSAAPVTRLFCGTAFSLVVLSATTFALACVGLLVAVGWIGPYPLYAVDGTGRLSCYACIACSFVSMALATALKFRTRAYGKTVAAGV